MTWSKLDDGFWGHPKVVAAGNEAVGAYCRGLSYCGSQLTDGFIPADVARFLAGRKQPIKRLVNVGLWIEVDGGFEVHDYLEFNPSRAQKEEEQARKSRGGRRGGLASGQARREAKPEAYASPDAEADALAGAEGGATAKNEPRPVPVPSRTRVEKETTVSSSTSDFDDWLNHFHHVTGRTAVTGSKKARSLFNARRREHSLAELKLAVEGCHGDPWLTARSFDVPETILRGDNVTRYIELARQPRTATTTTERAEARIQSGLRGELAI